MGINFHGSSESQAPSTLWLCPLQALDDLSIQPADGDKRVWGCGGSCGSLCGQGSDVTATVRTQAPAAESGTVIEPWPRGQANTQKSLPETQGYFLSGWAHAGRNQRFFQEPGQPFSVKGRELKRPLPTGNSLKAGHDQTSPACLREVIQVSIRRKSPPCAPWKSGHKILLVIKVEVFWKRWGYDCGSELMGGKSLLGQESSSPGVCSFELGVSQVNMFLLPQGLAPMRSSVESLYRCRY